jgi:hypothetical protein
MIGDHLHDNIWFAIGSALFMLWAGFWARKAAIERDLFLSERKKLQERARSLEQRRKPRPDSSVLVLFNQPSGENEMQQIYPDEGLVTQLVRIMGDDVHYHLFVNDVTPDRDTVLADFTEAAFTGYVEVTVEAADFTIDGVSAHVGYIQAPPITFSNGSGVDQDAYGYYVTDVGDTEVLAAARFDAAPVTKPDGDQWSVIPVWGDSSSLSGG